MDRKDVFQEAVTLAKDFKQASLKSTDSGDMPPVVLGFVGDSPELMVVAPQVDKMLAMQAVAIMRATLGIDAAAVCVDTRMARVTRGDPVEAKRIADKYSTPGSMQAAQLAGTAGDEIIEAITVQYLTADGRISAGTYPYRYGGRKGQQPFGWISEYSDEMEGIVRPIEEIEAESAAIAAGRTSGDPSSVVKVGGLIPEMMLDMLQQQSCLQTLNLPPDGLAFAAHKLRVMGRQQLIKLGYMLVEMTSKQHADPADFVKDLLERCRVSVEASHDAADTRNRIIFQLAERAQAAKRMGELAEVPVYDKVRELLVEDQLRESYAENG